MKTKIMALVAICLLVTATAGWAKTDNGDGTVTDGNLVWLKDANCFGELDWYAAVEKVKGLSSGSCKLSDKSRAGQWRLPTTTEMVARYADKSGFKSIKEYYWTSTELKTELVYNMDMFRGYGAAYPKTKKFHVWPVRAVK
jgi:hypothetical protein